MKLTPPTPDEVSQAFELLKPETLLMSGDLADLDDELKAELHDRLCKTFFPIDWASRLQSILLLLHDAHRIDPTRFVGEVFLPWVRFRRTLQPNRARVGREMARIGETVEDSVEEAEHHVGLYRLIVSDLFDPYLTLLIASCEFIAGSFTDLDAANLKMGELNKVEFVDAHLRRRGDTVQMFRGYDARVRNAISHSGSHGYVVEGRSVLFRNINRGPQPKVSPVRWSVDELGWNGILVFELCSCLDAATELFGLDCVMPEVGDLTSFLEIVDAAFTPEQRAELRAAGKQNLSRIQTDKSLDDERRGALLSEILVEQFRLRDMAWLGIDFSGDKSTVMIAIPVEGDVTDGEVIRNRLLGMARYLILARSVFGLHGEHILVVETEGSTGRPRLMAMVPVALLDAYAEEKAGLVDFLKEGQFSLEQDRLEVVVDEKALAEFEDQSLGRRFPRKHRPDADAPV